VAFKVFEGGSSEAEAHHAQREPNTQRRTTSGRKRGRRREFTAGILLDPRRRAPELAGAEERGIEFETLTWLFHEPDEIVRLPNPGFRPLPEACTPRSPKSSAAKINQSSRFSKCFLGEKRLSCVNFGRSGKPQPWNGERISLKEANCKSLREGLSWTKQTICCRFHHAAIRACRPRDACAYGQHCRK
jgi:hypothetical protein